MPNRLVRSIPQLVCACGEEAARVTIDGSRGIVDNRTRQVEVLLDWTCLSGHGHTGWLPEDEADKLMRSIVESKKNSGRPS